RRRGSSWRLLWSRDGCDGTARWCRRCHDRQRYQEALLRVDKVGPFVIGKLKIVAQNDCLGRAGFLAIAAKDAADHVDLVTLRIALAGRVALGVGVLGGLDVDRLGRAGRGTERAADAA